jgi:uncharacterized repeat protein (TIGR03803 family)
MFSKYQLYATEEARKMESKSLGWKVAQAFLVGVAAMVLATVALAAGPKLKTLYRLLLDPAGNIFSTTASGGPLAEGVVFELKSSNHGLWTESLLRVRLGLGADGPDGGLVSDKAGNLYGTTLGGGPFGAGTVFELSPPKQGAPWILTVLHAFEGGTDGMRPYGGVVFDQAGNLYGATSLGGGSTRCLSGCGIVFQLVAPVKLGGAWTEHILHRFKGDADAATPVAGLTIDSHGHLYGTTIDGGANGGTVFEIAPSEAGGAWTETVLHSFTGSDGASPYGGLTLDAAGNLYGAATYGGNFGCAFGNSCGLVFQLEPPAKHGDPWTENVLFAFPSGSSGGANPFAGVVFDAKGNLYGTAEIGGFVSQPKCNYGCGLVFELSPPVRVGGAWTESVLYEFKGGADGALPTGDLIFDQKGALLGTSSGGNPGGGAGTVFRLVP